MHIGDEEYVSLVKNKIFVSPGESKKTAQIGSIYNIGIEKIRNHEYRSNRVEFEIEVLSGEIGSKKLKYQTRVLYEVNVCDEKPLITLIEESYT